MLTLILLTFSLVANFLMGLGAFPFVSDIGNSTDSTEDALGDYTTLGANTNFWSIFSMVTVGTGVAAIALAWITHSMIPIGIHLFGAVFWASWGNMVGIFSYGGYIPSDLILIFTVGALFVFIAAIIGMITGSG